VDRQSNGDGDGLDNQEENQAFEEQVAKQINTSAFKEIRSSMWYGRLRVKPMPGGGSIE